MNYQLVFRSRWGNVAAIGVAFLGLVFVGMIWGSSGPLLALLSATLPLFLAYITWWIWSSPRLIADSCGLTVRNQLRTYRIAWPSFREAQSSFGLYLLVQQNSRDSADGNQDEGDWNHFPLTGGNPEPGKRVFVAATPARGGLSTVGQKAVPEVPDLYFERGPRITLRVTPAIASAMLNEEKLLQAGSAERPTTHRASKRQVEDWETRGATARWLYGEPPQETPEPFHDVTTTINWPTIAGFVVATVAAALYGLNF